MLEDQSVEKIIQNNSGSLFLEQDSIKEWEGVITRLVRERIPSNNINVEIEKLPSVQSSNEDVEEVDRDDENNEVKEESERDRDEVEERVEVKQKASVDNNEMEQSVDAVSYTHLTLPTNREV